MIKKKLKFSPKFRFGTGVGKNDLVVEKIDTDEFIGDVYVEGLIGDGELFHEIESKYSYSFDISPYIVPGYFYIGDRECYAFGEKITQFAKPVTENGITYLELLQYPDGMFPRYMDSDAQKEARDNKRGAAPIIVSKFAAGTLEGINVVFDQPISSENGIDGINGYCDNGLDDVSKTEVIVGDPANWPWYFTPLERYSKCYDYWREDNVLPLSKFTYDFFNNRIILRGTLTQDDLNSEYMIEYEGSNTSFKAPRISMSPLDRIPEDAILCMTTDTNIESEYEGIIEISVPKKQVYSELIPVTIQVKSKDGNRMPGVTCEARLLRSNIVSTVLPVSEPFLQFYRGPGSWEMFDAITVQNGIIYEGSQLLCNSNRISGKAIVRSAGKLYPQTREVYDAYLGSAVLPPNGSDVLTLVTDENGIAILYYLAPRNTGGSIGVSIRISTGIAESEEMVVLPVDDHSSPYLFDTNPINNTWETVQEVTGETVNTSVFVQIPVTCISPSSVGICTYPEYVSSAMAGTAPDYSYPIAIHKNRTIGGTVRELVAEYSITPSADNKYMMVYNKSVKDSRLDERNTYE